MTNAAPTAAAAAAAAAVPEAVSRVATAANACADPVVCLVRRGCWSSGCADDRRGRRSDSTAADRWSVPGARPKTRGVAAASHPRRTPPVRQKCTAATTATS